jgi:hypothetical protein
MLDLGFYHRLLTPYFDWFPQENLFIRIFEDFFTDEEASCKELFEFLGVDSTFKPRTIGTRINVSTDSPARLTAPLRGYLIYLLNTKPMIPVKELLHRLRVNRIRRHVAHATHTSKHKSTDSLSADTRARLLAEFEPDIERLEKMLGRNLDIWRT